MAGCVVMTTSSLPEALDSGAGVPGLGVAMVLVGLGVASIKATIYPFLGDQYVQQKPQLTRRKDGEMVIIDGPQTLQFMYNAYFWLFNFPASTRYVI